MLNNYFTLAALVHEIRGDLEGSRIFACSTRVESTLEVSLEKSGGDRVGLVTSCRPRMNYLYLERRYGKHHPGANVLAETVGATINSISVLDDERTVVLKLSNDRSLIVNLFGSHANVLLADEGNKVLGTFLKRKSINPAGLKGLSSKQSFPENAEEFVTEFKATVGNSQQRLCKIVPPFSGPLAKEVFYRLGGKDLMQKAADVEFCLTDDQLNALFEKISDVRRELMEPIPRIYFRGDAPLLMSLIDMKHLGSPEVTFHESINTCIGAFVTESVRHSGQVELKEGLLDRLRRRKEDLQRTISKINKNSTERREEEYREYGNLLMQHLNEIDKGASFFQTDDNEGSVRVPLDSRLTPVANAQVYFEKSKKARESRRTAITRREELQKLLAKVETEMQEAERETDINRLTTMRKKEEAEVEARTPFRQFEKKGYRIYVGKDAKSNDELTFGFAKPNDVFLHARGVSGSHVIIRNSSREIPARPIVEYAASIAAHYSKARSSGIVPVAYSMRKFVKKAKGKPGAVVIDREEVIFVKPEIPG